MFYYEINQTYYWRLILIIWNNAELHHNHFSINFMILDMFKKILLIMKIGTLKCLNQTKKDKLKCRFCKKNQIEQVASVSSDTLELMCVVCN